MKHVKLQKLIFIDDSKTHGGAQIALLNAILALQESEKYEIGLVVSNCNQLMISEFERSSRVKIFYCKPSRRLNIFFFWLNLANFRTVLRNRFFEDADHWIINLSGIEFGLAPLALLKSMGIPVTGWLHNPERYSVMIHSAPQPKALLNKIRDQIGERLIVHNYLQIMVPTRSSERNLQLRAKGKVKVEILQNVMRANNSSDPIGNKMQRNEVSRTGVCNLYVVGRIEFCTKGQDRCIPVAIELRKRGFKFHFIFVGNGADESALAKRFKDASLESAFEITGWQARPQAYDDPEAIILIPSRFESFSLVALESMNFGKRIVASKLDSLSEVLPVGRLVDFDDERATADLVIRSSEITNSTFHELYQPNLSNFSREIFLINFTKIIG